MSYPSEEWINNRIDSVNTILQSLYSEVETLNNCVTLHEKELKALYLLQDVNKGIKK